MKTRDKISTTEDAHYTKRLIDKQSATWRRHIDVQAPYRLMLQRLRPGVTLEVGCGVGRQLINLGEKAVGIDHNPLSVAYCRDRNLVAFTPEEFLRSKHSERSTFDSLLFSHILEHMTEPQAAELISNYTKHLKPEGRMILITPQESGFRSDPTHVAFMDFEALRRIAEANRFSLVKKFSFPLPRPAGHIFRYNEFVVIAKRHDWQPSSVA